MNRKVHLILILGCVIIAALDAPRASRLFTEGLSGPYARVEARAPLAPRRELAAGAPTKSPRTAPAQPARDRKVPTLIDSSVVVDDDDPAAH